MSILFYDHLVNKEEIFLLIDSHDEAENQKNRARQLVDDIIHHEIINFILEKLSQSKHKTFLTLVEERPYDPEIILFLQDHIHPAIENDLEQYMKTVIEQIKKDFLGGE